MASSLKAVPEYNWFIDSWLRVGGKVVLLPIEVKLEKAQDCKPKYAINKAASNSVSSPGPKYIKKSEWPEMEQINLSTQLCDPDNNQVRELDCPFFFKLSSRIHYRVNERKEKEGLSSQ